MKQVKNVSCRIADGKLNILLVAGIFFFFWSQSQNQSHVMVRAMIFFFLLCFLILICCSVSMNGVWSGMVEEAIRYYIRNSPFSWCSLITSTAEWVDSNQDALVIILDTALT